MLQFFLSKMPYPIPNNETQRLEALRRYGLLDTEPEQFYDDFAFIASQICGTSIALVTLIDENRQWFKAKVGIEGTETPREYAFCAHTIMSDEVMIVEDATADARFASNPFVLAEPNVRFYAGAPLIDSDGFGLGALCVVDNKPRSMTPEQTTALKALARQVVAMCEFRRVSGDLAKALAEVKILRGLLPTCAYCKSIRNDEGYWRSMESYICSHSEADFTHGICPSCLQIHFPTVYTRLKASGELEEPPAIKTSPS